MKQARNIDCCLKKHYFEKREEKTEKMLCGKVVIGSLEHWCGARGVTGTKKEYKKITHKKCGGFKGKKKTKFVGAGKVLAMKEPKDKDLLCELEKLQKIHKKNGKTIYRNRIQLEINYLEKCMATTVQNECKKNK